MIMIPRYIVQVAAALRSRWSSIWLNLGSNLYVNALLPFLCLTLFGVGHLIVAGVIWFAVMWFGIASITIDERGKNDVVAADPAKENHIQEFREPGSARSASMTSADGILSKYSVSLSIVGVAMLLGTLARAWAIRPCIAKNGFNVRSWLPGVAKTGIVCGGLIAATLAASIAVIQATVADEKRLPAGSTQTETMVWLAFLLVYIVVVAAYVGALDQIKKKP